ncbi:MAG: thiamine diphosphokinase [Deltaproteobacteria bacterium HGW-Deltaproteobacteria-10]|nr:MAG: thiamine diphosphokinase [Deltaproteobacteria bacterium HGW-Deltaproteobacteria-10]
MTSKIIIISNGKLGDPGFFQKRLAALDSFLTICCDGGIRHLAKLKIRPDVIMGDMDSANKRSLDDYAASGAKILKYPPDKDATDTQLALEYALGLRPAAIEIWGALGGRIDHALANLFLLKSAQKAGIKTMLIDEYCEAFIVEQETTFADAVGQTVSLFAVSSQAEGVSLHGFKYSLDNKTLEMSNPRGISNVVVSSPATINICAGSLLVVRYWLKDFFPEAV